MKWCIRSHASCSPLPWAKYHWSYSWAISRDFWVPIKLDISQASYACSPRSTVIHLQELNARLNFNDLEIWGQLCSQWPVGTGNLASELVSWPFIWWYALWVTILQDRNYYPLHAVEGTKAQRGQVTGPRSHDSLQGTSTASKPNQWYSEASER